MSKRYTFTTPYKDAYEIVDRDIDKAMKPEDVADLLNEQAQRISELEEQLEECIRPKFKIGQEVFYIVDKYELKSGEVLEIQIWNLKKDNIIYVIEYSGNFHCESVVFKTLEEAEAKLKELQGEKR